MLSYIPYGDRRRPIASEEQLIVAMQGKSGQRLYVTPEFSTENISGHTLRELYERKILLEETP